MKKLIYHVALVLSLVILNSCSGNDTVEVKSESDIDSTIVTDAQISEASQNLGELMEKRAEMFKDGKIELNESDTTTIEKVKMYLSQSRGGQMNLKSCPWYKEIECSAALAAAVLACGGPEDVPCIVAALGAMSSCIECL